MKHFQNMKWILLVVLLMKFSYVTYIITDIRFFYYLGILQQMSYISSDSQFYSEAFNFLDWSVFIPLLYLVIIGFQNQDFRLSSQIKPLLFIFIIYSIYPLIYSVWLIFFWIRYTPPSSNLLNIIFLIPLLLGFYFTRKIPTINDDIKRSKQLLYVAFLCSIVLSSVLFLLFFVGSSLVGIDIFEITNTYGMYDQSVIYTLPGFVSNFIVVLLFLMAMQRIFVTQQQTIEDERDYSYPQAGKS